MGNKLLVLGAALAFWGPMKFSVLFAAAVLCLATLSARAEVLIYSGTVKSTQPSVRRKPFIQKAFLVTDTVGKSTQLVTYGKFDRVKNRDEEAINVGNYFSGALTTGGPLMDLYTFVRQVDDQFGLLRHSIFLRGYQKSVQVSLNQGQPVTAMRAKFLTGSVRKLAGGLGTLYLEQELSLELDKDRTIDVNVRGISAATAYTEIRAFLEAKGFTNLRATDDAVPSKGLPDVRFRHSPPNEEELKGDEAVSAKLSAAPPGQEPEQASCPTNNRNC